MTKTRHRLYVIHGSHPCVAVERALELKGLEWDVSEVVPPMQIVVMRMRFGGTTVPAIRFADGEKVQGSMAIMRRLDERFPDPPLYSADVHHRARAAEAERWGDDELQMITRRLLFAGFRRRKDALASYSETANIRFPRWLTRAVAPLVIAGEWKVHSITAEQIAHDIDGLPHTFDRIDGWITAGVLGGEQPSAADLQIAGSVRLLLTMADVRERFGDRPAAAFAMRLIPHYDGDLPAGALG